MTFNHYNSFPVKVRLIKLQEALIEKGYSNVIVNGKRDKPTIKALQDFQKQNGLVTNAVVDVNTFSLLNIK